MKTTTHNRPGIQRRTSRQMSPAFQKAVLKSRLQASSRALQDVDLDNMTPEHRRAAHEYIHVVEKLAQEHGYIVTFSGVESLKRALAK
jgi:hypothetical protein